MPQHRRATGNLQAPRDEFAPLLARIPELVATSPIGVVLGSGLGGFARSLSDAAHFEYRDLPGAPLCRVPGHAGIMHVRDASVAPPLVVFEGRAHLYEGATLAEVTFVARLLAHVRARALILCCSAGALNPGYEPGDLMLVTDHINLSGEDPARLQPFGTQKPLFPSQAQIYEPRLLERLSALAFQMGLRFRRGVLAAVRGPSYESPAEARALRLLGADAVCMSVVLEAMAGAAGGVPILGIAVITNRSGDHAAHDDVLAAAGAGGRSLEALLSAALEVLEWKRDQRP